MTRKASTLHEDQYTFCSYFAPFFSKREILQTKVFEKIKTHFMFSNFSFRKSCRSGDNVKNMVQPDTPHMTIWRIGIVCWISKARHTHS